MEALLPLLIIIISLAVRASKNKKRKTAAFAARTAAKTARPPVRKAPQNAASASTARKPAVPVRAAAVGEEFIEGEGGGSIVMPSIEPHEHEGKPMPCPADEREAPRPRPAQLAPQEVRQVRQGLRLSFSRSQVVQAVVMAEVLQRPRFEKGRRVIR